jgi:hypothetical protein
LEALILVNADRVKRKIPSLLVGNCSNRNKNKKGWNAFMRSRYRLGQFKKRNPEQFNTLTHKVISDLDELEKAVLNDS